MQPTGPRSQSVAFPAALALLVPLAAGPLSAQSGQEVMGKAVEAYETRIEGIREYTVTQRVDVMGTTVTNHFVKRTRDGHPVFVRADREEGGQGPRGWGNPYQLFLDMARRAELEGRTTVGGHEAWTLTVSDFSGVDARRMTPAGSRGEFHPAEATFQIDVESYVIRRLSVSGAVGTDGSKEPIEMIARFADYRERGGMLYPFRTDVSVEGMKAVMSPEERRRARRQLRAIRARLDSMSASRREEVEARIRPQIEQLERTVESGRLEVTVEVQELTVNGGGGDG